MKTIVHIQQQFVFEIDITGRDFNDIAIKASELTVDEIFKGTLVERGKLHIAAIISEDVPDIK